MTQRKIIQLNGGAWYIESRTGYEGPFESKKEAEYYAALIQSAEAARCEFAGLAFNKLQPG